MYALVVDSAPSRKNGHKMSVAGCPAGHQTLMFWNRMYLEGEEQAGRENMTPNVRAELRAELRGAQEAHGESLDEGARAAGRRPVDGVPQDEQEQV